MNPQTLLRFFEKSNTSLFSLSSFKYMNKFGVRYMSPKVRRWTIQVIRPCLIFEAKQFKVQTTNFQLRTNKEPKIDAFTYDLSTYLNPQIMNLCNPYLKHNHKVTTTTQKSQTRHARNMGKNVIVYLDWRRTRGWWHREQGWEVLSGWRSLQTWCETVLSWRHERGGRMWADPRHGGGGALSRGLRWLKIVAFAAAVKQLMRSWPGSPRRLGEHSRICASLLSTLLTKLTRCTCQRIKDWGRPFILSWWVKRIYKITRVR